MTRGRKPEYTAESIKNDCIKLIKTDENVVFLVDIFRTLNLTADTFYKKCPKDSAEYQEIMDALDANKGVMKRRIRDRLLDMNNPTALICLYKLLGNADERAALNNHKTKDEGEKKENNDIILEIQ